MFKRLMQQVDRLLGRGVIDERLYLSVDAPDPLIHPSAGAFGPRRAPPERERLP